NVAVCCYVLHVCHGSLRTELLARQRWRVERKSSGCAVILVETQHAASLLGELPQCLLQVLQISLLPIFCELLQANISQGMMEHHLENFEWHGANLGARECGIHDVHGMP